MEKEKAKKTEDNLPAKAENKLPDIDAKGGGLLVAKNYEQQREIAKQFAASGMLPAAYHGKPAMVLTAMQFAFELGLKPLSAMRQMAVINGTPALFGDLPLALVRNSKNLGYFKEFAIDADMNEICFENKNLNTEAAGAVCTLQRVGGEKRSFAFTLKDAERAGLLARDTWKKYPGKMMKYRARSEALKTEFGDILSGVGIAEYDYDIQPEEIQIVNEGEQLDAENEACINAIESLFRDLNYTRALQTQMINKYDGHGRLQNIQLDGLVAMLDELKTIKSKQVNTEAEPVEVAAEVITQGETVEKEDSKEESSEKKDG